MQYRDTSKKRVRMLTRKGLAVLVGIPFLLNLTVNALVLLVSLDARADFPIYRKAPPAEELAGILFPPRYRAIVLNDSQSEPRPVFGLMINFEFDSTAIVAESVPLLASVGEMLRLARVRDESIVIEGHTDASGTDQYNKRLSERRARAVKRYLVDNYGVDPSRLTIVGKGEHDLYDRANPADAINRRVQFRPASGYQG